MVERIVISTRLHIQSDDPVRQAVDALPGAILTLFWYNLFAKTKLTTEVRKLITLNKPLFDNNSVCPLCSSVLSIKRLRKGRLKIKCSKCRFKYYPQPEQVSPVLLFAVAKKDVLSFLDEIPKNAETGMSQADEKLQKPEEHPLSEVEGQ